MMIRNIIAIEDIGPWFVRFVDSSVAWFQIVGIFPKMQFSGMLFISKCICYTFRSEKKDM